MLHSLLFVKGPPSSYKLYSRVSMSLLKVSDFQVKIIPVVFWIASHHLLPPHQVSRTLCLGSPQDTLYLDEVLVNPEGVN